MVVGSTNVGARWRVEGGGGESMKARAIPSSAPQRHCRVTTCKHREDECVGLLVVAGHTESHKGRLKHGCP